MRHLTQRLALLLASFQGASRVAKRKDRQHIEAGRDVEQRLDFLEPTEAYPVRAHAIGPRRQQHGLDRAARVGDREPSLVSRHDDCHRCLCDIRPARSQGPELAQCLGVANHDEVPRLPVHPAASEASSLDDPSDHGIWHRLVLVTAHRKERADGLEDVLRPLGFTCAVRHVSSPGRTSSPGRASRSSGGRRGSSRRRLLHSFRARSRSLTFWILTELVIGNSSTNTTWRGILKLATRPRQCSITSRSTSVQPGASCTKATATSDSPASGSPTTAATSIAAWLIRKASTSMGSTFSPTILSMSL